MKTKEQLNLRKSFPPPKWEDWKQLVIDSLKGADYDKKMKSKTYEGITLEPIYRKEDIPDLAFARSEPGRAPYLRGNDPQKRFEQGWYVSQVQTEANLKDLNARLKEELRRGLSMVNLQLKHDDVPDGISIKSKKDLRTAFEGIDLKAAPLFVQMDMDDEDIFGLLDEYLTDQGQQPRDLTGCLGYDPASEFARKGYLNMSLEETWQRVKDRVIVRANRAPGLRAFIIDGTVYEAAGASASQEMGMVLATGIGYIKGLLSTGMDINTIAGLFAVKLSLGSNLFMEIAKIRAFRLIWSEMIKAFDGNEASQKVWVHGKTAVSNKSTYDLYVNMLRTTTETFSGVIGGADSIQTDSFDQVLKEESVLGRRIARNQQLILAEEAHLSKVTDPAGGCYYVESLTAQLAEIAWQKMQEIEKEGGMIPALQAGKIHEMLAKTAQARIEAVHKRRDIFVGVNMYANPDDQPVPVSPAKAPSADKAAVKLKSGALPKIRVMSQLEELRGQISRKAPKIMLLNIGSVAEYKARADFSSGFFQVGGYQVMGEASFANAQEAIKAAKSSDADAFCICSTDAKYEELVEPLCRGIKPGILILAGYPRDKVDAYKAAGIDFFIHVRANIHELLRDLAKKLEVL